MEGRLPAPRFRRLVTLTMVAGWTSMAIGVALSFSEGAGVRHDLGLLIYAIGFCAAAIASLLAAIRLRGLAIAVALPFAGLGAVELWVADVAALGVGLSCRGGCPPDHEQASLEVFAVAVAALANLLAAAAIVVVPLIVIIVGRTAAALRRRPPGDPT